MAKAKAKAAQEEMIQEAPSVYCLGKMVPIDEVKPNPENYNVHPQEQLEVLADVLRANGWRQPIVVSKLSGLVVKGHGRLQTAMFMKLKEVPVDYQDYADAQAEYQDMIADNRTAQLSYVDAFKLGNILKKMSTEGQGHTGYTQEEIALFAAAEYVAPEKSERKFAILETLKMTREQKAIVVGAVQKFCLRIGKEIDFGEALSQICMGWLVLVLPTIHQGAGQDKKATVPPEPAEPPPAPKVEAPKEQPQSKKKSKPPKGKEEANPSLVDVPQEVEVEFKVAYAAGSYLGERQVIVVRASTGERYYTEDKAHEALAKSAKDAGSSVCALIKKQDGQWWIISIEEVK